MNYTDIGVLILSQILTVNSITEEEQKQTEANSSKQKQTVFMVFSIKSVNPQQFSSSKLSWYISCKQKPYVSGNKI